MRPSDETLSAIREFLCRNDITGIKSWYGLVEEVNRMWADPAMLVPVLVEDPAGRSCFNIGEWTSGEPGSRAQTNGKPDFVNNGRMQFLKNYVDERLWEYEKEKTNMVDGLSNGQSQSHAKRARFRPEQLNVSMIRKASYT